MARSLIDLVSLGFQLFELLIFARILLSWINADPYNPMVQFLHRATEPFLAPIRERLPSMGMFDLSPLIVIVIAMVVHQFVRIGLINLLCSGFCI
jgi:YggT family protein